jgi:uncharacterized protein YjbJ (UPF0337 family)
MAPRFGGRGRGNPSPDTGRISKEDSVADNSGPEEGIKGAVEGVKGKAKEVAGTVAGRDDLQREGQAQQDKADAQREASQKEAEAEAARGAASANEAREKAEQ